MNSVIKRFCILLLISYLVSLSRSYADSILIELPDSKSLTSSGGRIRLVQWLDNNHLLLLGCYGFDVDDHRRSYAYNSLINVNIKNRKAKYEVLFPTDVTIYDYAVDPNKERILYICGIENDKLFDAFYGSQLVIKSRIPLPRRPVYNPIIYIKPIGHGEVKKISEEEDTLFYHWIWGHSLQWLSADSFIYIHNTYSVLPDSLLDHYNYPWEVTADLVVQDLSNGYNIVNVPKYLTLSTKDGFLYVWVLPEHSLSAEDSEPWIMPRHISLNGYRYDIQCFACKPLPGYEDQIFYYHKSYCDSLVLVNLETGQSMMFWLGADQRYRREYAISPNDSLIVFVSERYVDQTDMMIRLLVRDLSDEIHEGINKILDLKE